MSDKKIILSTLYTSLCVTILIITGVISDVSLFTIFLRSFVFGIISFFLIFCAQLFLQNGIIGDDILDNDEYSSDAKGHAVNVVIDDSYDAKHENVLDNGSEAEKDFSDDSTDGSEKVQYNTSRRIDGALFYKTMNENNSRSITDSSVDLSHEIKRSQKEASGNPGEYSNALKKWIHNAQSKKA